MTRVSTAFNEAWEQERKKGIDLARDLAAARKEIDALKRRSSRVENSPKSSSAEGAKVRIAQRKSAKQDVDGTQVRKSRVVRLTKVVLPDELLPTRPPIEGFRQ